MLSQSCYHAPMGAMVTSKLLVLIDSHNMQKLAEDSYVHLHGDRLNGVGSCATFFIGVEYRNRTCTRTLYSYLPQSY